LSSGTESRRPGGRKTGARTDRIRAPGV